MGYQQGVAALAVFLDSGPCKCPLTKARLLCHCLMVRLLVCPWLPAGGVWRPSIHKHLVQPFKQQVRAFLLCLNQLERSGEIQSLHPSATENLVAALFQVTFLADQQQANGGVDVDGDYIASCLEQQVSSARQDGERPLGVDDSIAENSDSDETSSWETVSQVSDV